MSTSDSEDGTHDYGTSSSYTAIAVSDDGDRLTDNLL